MCVCVCVSICMDFLGWWMVCSPKVFFSGNVWSIYDRLGFWEQGNFLSSQQDLSNGWWMWYVVHAAIPKVKAEISLVLILAILEVNWNLNGVMLESNPTNALLTYPRISIRVCSDFHLKRPYHRNRFFHIGKILPSWTSYTRKIFRFHPFSPLKLLIKLKTSG